MENQINLAMMKKRKLFCSLVQTLNSWHKINILFVQSSKIVPNRPFIGRICYCWTDWIRIIQISNKNRFFFIKLCLHATNFAMDGIKEYIHATTMGKSTLIAFSLESKCVFFFFFFVHHRHTPHLFAKNVRWTMIEYLLLKHSSNNNNK